MNLPAGSQEFPPWILAPKSRGDPGSRLISATPWDVLSPRRPIRGGLGGRLSDRPWSIRRGDPVTNHAPVTPSPDCLSDSRNAVHAWRGKNELVRGGCVHGIREFESCLGGHARSEAKVRGSSLRAKHGEDHTAKFESSLVLSRYSTDAPRTIPAFVEV